MGDTGVMIHIQSLIDDAKCFETVRTLRWPDGVSCPHCDSFDVTKQGRDDTQPERQRYLCQACERRFDDLTDTIFAGHHHQVLRDAPGFSHGEVSRCLRSRQSIWCSPQGWDTPGFSHGEEVTPCGCGYCACISWDSTSRTTKLPTNLISIRTTRSR